MRKQCPNRPWWNRNDSQRSIRIGDIRRRIDLDERHNNHAHNPLCQLPACNIVQKLSIVGICMLVVAYCAFPNSVTWETEATLIIVGLIVTNTWTAGIILGHFAVN